MKRIFPIYLMVIINSLMVFTIGCKKEESAPSLSTTPAHCISSTRAKLNGIINTYDLSTVVTFEYGTTTGYGQEVTADESPLTGNLCRDISAIVIGLNSGTTYHFRVKAVNSLGTFYGEDITFITPNPLYGLYTVKTGTDELYFIDLTTNSFTKVDNIGLVLPNLFSGMQLINNKLYISFGSKLYTYDLSSGILTQLISNADLSWQFSINSLGELYSVFEQTGPTQGSLYKINITTNSSTKIGTTTGSASIWGLGFDSNNQLWAVDEFVQKYGTMNTVTGTFTATSSTILYSDTYYATPDNNDHLYSFNVGIPTGIVKYYITNNTATLIIPVSTSWAGLAYGPF